MVTLQMCEAKKFRMRRWRMSDPVKCAKTGVEDPHGVSGILCVKAVFKISEDNPFLGEKTALY